MHVPFDGVARPVHDDAERRGAKRLVAFQSPGKQVEARQEDDADDDERGPRDAAMLARHPHPPREDDEHQQRDRGRDEKHPREGKREPTRRAERRAQRSGARSRSAPFHKSPQRHGRERDQERLAHLRSAHQNGFGIERVDPRGGGGDFYVPLTRDGLPQKRQSQRGHQRAEEDRQQRTMRVGREEAVGRGAERQQPAVLVGVEILVEGGEDRLVGLRQFPGLRVAAEGVEEDVARLVLWVIVAACGEGEVERNAEGETEEESKYSNQ